MARDLDFSPRRRKVIQQSAVPQIAAAKPTELLLKPRRSWRGLIWFLIILLILAISGWVGWYYYKQQGSYANSPSSVVNTTQNIPTTSKSVFGQTQSINVQVYDSGAGKEIVDKVVTQLKGLGYPAENVNESQFKYDRTYIWYREGLLTEAEKIKSVLTGRDIGLKETKVAGSFDILVLLGNK